MTEPQTAQTTQAPEAPDLSGREVLRVAELKVVLVEYTDADNRVPVTRLVAILPATPTTGEVAYFLDQKMEGRPAQKWFTAQVIAKLRKTVG